jgi:hypothetical protein
MPGLVSTSIAEELGRTAEPPTTEVVQRAAEVLAAALGQGLGASIDWQAPAFPEPDVPVAIGAA